MLHNKNTLEISLRRQVFKKNIQIIKIKKKTHEKTLSHSNHPGNVTSNRDKVPLHTH